MSTRGFSYASVYACVSFIIFRSASPCRFPSSRLAIGLFRDDDGDDDEEIAGSERARENRSRAKESNLALNVRTRITI